MTLGRRIIAALMAPLVAVVAAVIITSLVVVLVGGSPGDFWSVILSKPADRAYVNIINQSAMLYLAAIAAAIGFRMNLFNIGVEGQYLVASFAAASFAGAAILPGKLNTFVAVLIAMVAGGLWAGIAGLLKVTRGVSEVISTIMLNAIAITLVGYFVNTYGQKYGSGRRTTPLPASSEFKGFHLFFLDKISGNVWTLGFLAILVGVLFWALLTWTRFGFDLRATGISETAAIASGVKVKQMVVISMVLSGAVAGLIWMPALFGSAHYYGPTFQTQLGFTGIAVALLGRNRPLGILFGAVLFAFLNEQSNRLTLETDISPNVIQISQGVIVLAVVVAYEVVRRQTAAAEQRAVTQKLQAEKAAEVSA
jgi:general nucleoside transport system permease protein